MSRALAEKVAVELTEHDALASHLDAELGIDPEDLTNPWHAAWASMAAFTAGAILPMVTIAFSPESVRVLVTVITVVAALALTGWVSANLGKSPALKAVLRNVGGGLLSMAVTYGIGALIGTSLA
jgi:VIT1/CCC1 family predicted Fe2+/Mn2+ transporter